HQSWQFLSACRLYYRFRTGRAALNLAGVRALMPRNSFGLTGLGAASKLFFLASQTACQRWIRESWRVSRRIVRGTTDARMSRTSAIYRFFCAFGFLLFVGIASFIPAQSSPTPTRELL